MRTHATNILQHKEGISLGGRKETILDLPMILVILTDDNKALERIIEILIRKDEGKCRSNKGCEN